MCVARSSLFYLLFCLYTFSKNCVIVAIHGHFILILTITSFAHNQQLHSINNSHHTETTISKINHFVKETCQVFMPNLDKAMHM